MIGAIFNVATFGHMLEGAPAALAVDALVVPFVLTGSTDSPLLQFLHEELLSLPAYKAIAPKLSCLHEYGDFNIVCDKGSRNEIEQMEDVLRHLGLNPQYVDVPPPVLTILDRAVDVWRALTDEGGRLVEGLEIVKTYRVLDGIAGIEFPTSTTKSTIRLTRPARSG